MHPRSEQAAHVPREVRQRDDGLFEVVSGDKTSGPFETIAFATAIAEGRRPEPKPASRHRHYKLIREVRRAASAPKVPR